MQRRSKERFLDLLQYFIVFGEDTDSDQLHKIIASYHQFHAVWVAVAETLQATSPTEGGSAVRAGGGHHCLDRQLAVHAATFERRAGSQNDSIESGKRVRRAHECIR